MKILVLHNSYQQRGGEDSVVQAEKELLENWGHEVELKIVNNDLIKGVWSKFKATVDVSGAPLGTELVARSIEKGSPDIVHIHNSFPLISWSAHRKASAAGIAVVQTLHNYRMFCAAATLSRNGQICEKCLHGNKLWAVVHRCYKNSTLGSLAVAQMQNSFMYRQDYKCVDRFIALSEFSKQKFIEGGLSGDSIAVKQNFTPIVKNISFEGRDGFVCVGRLSPEKGIAIAVEAFAHFPSENLTVIGDGPEIEYLRHIAPSNVRFTGMLPRDEVNNFMSRAKALIMPSIWYETFGMTVIEAMACGTPVIASDIAAMHELIDDKKSGLLFVPGSKESLIRSVSKFLERGDLQPEMGRRAAERHALLYSPQKNAEMLLDIYDKALESRRIKGKY